MNDLIQTAFGEVEEIPVYYIGLPLEVRASLQQRAQKIKRIMEQTALDVGRELYQAHEEIKPYRDGGFKGWVEDEVGIKETYAHSLIRVYEHFGETRVTLVSQFSGEAMRLLSYDNVPQEARDEAIALAEKEKVTVQKAKDLIEDAKLAKEAQKRAEEAEKKAREEAKLAQRRLSEAQKAIDVLQEDMEKLAAQKKEDTPETKAKLEKSKTQIKTLTEQRDKLLAMNKKLSEDLDAIEERKEQELRELKIRLKWQKTTEAIYKGVQQFLGQFPLPIDTEIFESEDWARLDQVIDVFQQGIASCNSWRRNTSLQVIEAGKSGEYVTGP